MKKLIIAIVLTGITGAVHAADLYDLKELKTAEVWQTGPTRMVAEQKAELSGGKPLVLMLATSVFRKASLLKVLLDTSQPPFGPDPVHLQPVHFVCRFVGDINGGIRALETYSAYDQFSSATPVLTKEQNELIAQLAQQEIGVELCDQATAAGAPIDTPAARKKLFDQLNTVFQPLLQRLMK